MIVALRFLLHLAVFFPTSVQGASTVESILVQIRRLVLKKILFAAIHTTNVLWFMLQSTLGAHPLSSLQKKPK